jgi:hypothetical protein
MLGIEVVHPEMNQLYILIIQMEVLLNLDTQNNLAMERWTPVDSIPKELFLDEIVDDYRGMSISLRGENSDRVLLVQFGLFVLSYQSTAEHCVLKTLDDNPDIKGPWPLFMSRNSEYINWLVQESYKIIENDAILHYLIKHADGIINIVSSKAPQVKWID